MVTIKPLVIEISNDENIKNNNKSPNLQSKDVLDFENSDNIKIKQCTFCSSYLSEIPHWNCHVLNCSKEIKVEPLEIIDEHVSTEIYSPAQVSSETIYPNTVDKHENYIETKDEDICNVDSTAVLHYNQPFLPVKQYKNTRIMPLNSQLQCQLCKVPSYSLRATCLHLKLCIKNESYQAKDGPNIDYCNPSAQPHALNRNTIEDISRIFSDDCNVAFVPSSDVNSQGREKEQKRYKEYCDSSPNQITYDFNKYFASMSTNPEVSDSFPKRFIVRLNDENTTNFTEKNNLVCKTYAVSEATKECDVSKSDFSESLCVLCLLLTKSYKTHMYNHRQFNLPKCYLCNIYFITNSSFIDHVETMGCLKQSYNCSSCSKRFKEKKCLVKHLLTHKREKKVFPCTLCLNKFSSQLCAEKHLLTHADKNAKNCIICKKPYQKTNESKLHFLKVHTTLLPIYRCSTCGREFTKQAYLKRHSVMHTGETNFKCLECNSSFSLKESFYRHLKVHVLNRTKPFKCSFCGKGFAKKQDVKFHERKHTGEKPYKCSVCDLRFARPTNLSRHMEMHSEKMYTCATCNKSFLQRQSLLYHFQKSISSCSRNRGSQSTTNISNFKRNNKISP